jgi:hypothetical protein
MNPMTTTSDTGAAALLRPRRAAHSYYLETVPAAPVPAVAKPVELPEPYLSKQSLARHYAMSVRWVEQRMTDGLPHEHMDGRARFHLSETDPWLRSNGHLKAAA